MSEDVPPRVPPHNAEAEQELLGAMLVFWEPEMFAKVNAVLRADDFYSQQRKIVWRGICSVGGQGGHVDTMTVAYFLAGRSDSAGRSYLDLAGGGSALAVLASCATANGIVERAKIIATDRKWRDRLVTAHTEEDACYRRDEDAYQAAAVVAPRLRVVA